jgi:hypothetical protein
MWTRTGRRSSKQIQRHTHEALAAAVAAVARRGIPAFGLENLEARQMLALTTFNFDDAAGGSPYADAGGWFGTYVSDSGTGTMDVVQGHTKLGTDKAILFNNPATDQDHLQLDNMVGTDLSSIIGGTASLAFWINTTQIGTANASDSPNVLGIEQNSGTSDIFWGWINNTGRIGITVGNTLGGLSTNPINDGKWHHVVMTRDVTDGSATKGQVKLFVDGFVNAANTIADVAVKDLNPYKDLAKLPKTGAGTTPIYLNAAIDDFGFAGELLSDNEAKLLFDPTGTPPAAPSALTIAKTGLNGLRLTWQDNSANEARFDLERALQANFSDAQVIATLASNTTSFNDKALTAGARYYYRLRAVGAHGNSGYSNAVNAIPAGAAYTPGSGNGLFGMYFDEGGVNVNNVVDPASNFKGRLFTRTDGPIDFNWRTNAPISGMGADNLSIRWTGALDVPADDLYTFYALNDDGGFLYIDINKDGDTDDAGELVINDPSFHSMAAANEKSSDALNPGGISLTSGIYKIKFEAFEGTGDAGARLSWDSLNIRKEVIPRSQLAFTMPAGALTSAPTALTAIVSPTVPTHAIDLTWSDANSNEIGFKVLRSTTGAGGPFVEIAKAGGTSYTDNTVYPGKTYHYQVQAYNSTNTSGLSNTANASTTALPTGVGLLGQYHDDKMLTGVPEKIRVDGNINSGVDPNILTGVINWPDLDNNPITANFATGVAAIDDGSNFSARWQGALTVPTTGPYRFFSTTDDAVRVYVNGDRIVAAPNDFNAGHGAAEDTSPFVTLNAGVPYPFMMEYNQGTGGGRCELRWEGPGITKGMLTQQYLSATVTPPTAAPTGLTAIRGAVTATLRWTDTDLNEATNRIEVSTDGGATWGLARPEFAVDNDLQAAGTGASFIAGLYPSTTYQFRVVAANIVGEVAGAPITVTTLPMAVVTSTPALTTGNTDLTEGNLDWSHYGEGLNPAIRNAPMSVDYVAWEAEENATISQADTDTLGWTVVDNTTTPNANTTATQASRGKALYNSETAGTRTFSDSLVTWPITFKSAGTYRLYARRRTIDNDNDGSLGNNDSVRRPTGFNLTMPPVAANFVDWNFSSSTDWAWRTDTGVDYTVPAPGAYTFTLATREGGSMLDRLIFHKTNNLSGAQLDALPNAGDVRSGGPISLYTLLGANPVATPYETAAKTFSWTSGTPQNANPGTNDAVAVAGVGNGFRITLPAIQTLRTIRLYVGVDGAQGQLTASVSDLSMVPLVDSSLSSAAGLKTAVYEFKFKTEEPNHTLTIDWVSLGTGKVILQAVSFIETDSPAAPTTLVATALPGASIGLTWFDNATNETSYKVERKGPAGVWQTLTTNLNANVVAYTDNDPTLLSGMAYTYRARAVNIVGESDPSNEASAVPSLRSPVNLQATGRQGGVQLTWTTPPGVPVTYNIKRAPFIFDAAGAGVSGTETVIATGVTGTTYNDLDPTLQAGKNYYYWMQSTTGTETSGYGNYVMTTGMAGLPYARVNFTNLYSTSTGTGEDYLGYVRDHGESYGARNSLVYGWVVTDGSPVDPEAARGSARDRDDPTTPRPIDERYDSLNHMQQRSAAGTSWEIEVPNGTYYVHVVGGDISNVDSNIGFLFEGAVATGLVPIRLDGTTTNGDGSLVQWRFAEFYVVVVVSDGKLTVASDTVSPKPNPNPNTGNNGNNKITYIDINSYIPTEPPTAPTNLVAASIQGDGIALTWTDNATNESGYRVERRQTAGTWSAIAAINANATAYNDNDPTLLSGSTYTYRVVAVNIVGDSSPSNEASAVVSLRVPANFQGTGTQGGVRLNWTVPPGIPVTYNLKRAPFTLDALGNGVPGAQTVIATNLNATTFLDQTGLTVGQNYFYWIESTVTGESSGYGNPILTTAMIGAPLARINFTAGPAGTNGPGQDVTSPFVYLRDEGDAYGARSSGLNYGWLELNATTGLMEPSNAMQADARNRNRTAAPRPIDERYDSHTHVQKRLANTSTWEIEVPNGTYLIHVVGGDPDNANADIGYAFEPGTPNEVLTGVKALQTIDEQATAEINWRFAEFYVTVTVSDGKLTMMSDQKSSIPKDINGVDILPNGQAGYNNKLSYIDINAATAPAGPWDIAGSIIYVKLNGGTLERYDNATAAGAPVETKALSSVTAINVAGTAGDDLVLFDLGLGFALPVAYDGGPGNDTVRAAGLDNTIIISSLTIDGLVITSNAEVVDAGAGNDTITVSVAGVSILGGDGNDIINVSVAGASVNGGAGSDTVNVNAGGAIPTMAGVESLALNAGAHSLGDNVAGMSLSINTGASAIATKDLAVAGLTLSGTDALDMKTFDVNVAGGNVITLENYIKSKALKSSSTTVTTTLGVIPKTGSVLVKYTYFGDVNGDGVVNLNDYAVIDWGYLNKLPGYANGDVNYDTTINLNDYTLIDWAYLNQSGILSAPQAAAPVFSNTRVAKAAKARKAKKAARKARRIRHAK